MVCCGSVDVEDRSIRKPYLGGWRDKITSVEYLNAESQTGPRRMPKENMCSRMTQYIAIADKVTQTPCQHSTQMCRPDYFITNEFDKYLTSKPYETYEEMMKRLDHDGKAQIIQRNYRIYLLLKNVKKYAKMYRDLVEDCQKYEEGKLATYKKRHQLEILRRTSPESREDFDLLYDLVENWRRDRLGCAKLRFFKAARCAENYMILEKVVDMIKEIDKKRQDVRARFRNKNRVKFLTVNCKSIRWNGYKEKRVEMVTMRNQKARELKMIYDSLTNYDVTQGDRIEILTRLRKSLEVHNCTPAFDLIRLIEQELDYLSRGLDDIPLHHFRERLVYNYLYFVRASHSCCCTNGDPHFCKIVDDEKLREPIESMTKMCKSCAKLLPYRKFTVHGRLKMLTTCTGCTWLRERSISHVNYDPYILLLRCVRSEERKRNSPSAIAFAMQKHDMYHLVNNVWHGHSAVSENKDLFVLRMIRYDVNKEWSPWNCILLTESEAEVHYKIKDLDSVYCKDLIERVLMSHQVAKNQFKHLKKFEEEFRETFEKIKDREVYKPAIKVEDYNFL